MMSKKETKNKVYTIRRGKMEDENTWLFESLVGFLCGPIWNIPMMNFIENKSEVFDPNEENQEEYRKIHEEYKHLVDVMLDSFMQDLGITTEQFEKACSHACADSVTLRLRQNLFEQIWAAEDFDVFVRMMIQKNTELQLQALKYLKEFGVSFDVDDQEKQAPSSTEDDDSELQNVLRRSFEEHAESLAQIDKEKEELERALATTLEEEQRRLDAENQRELELLKKAVQLSIEESSSEAESKTTPVRQTPSVPMPSPADSLNKTILDASKPDLNSNEPLLCSKPEQQKQLLPKSSLGSPRNDAMASEVSKEDIAKRKAYLLQQRDKLLAKKKQERKKQLEDLEIAPGSRPKSAHAARNMLDNDKEGNNPNRDMLAARKALAARLRAEVVETEK